MLKLIKKQQGFTLLELLVVIAIIGLLASIVLVSYEGSTDKARLAKTLSWAGSVSHLLGDQAVGVWTFDNIEGTTVYDDSGLGNNGIFSGSYSIVDGTNGKAVQFNGGRVNLASITQTPPAMTFSGWFEKTTTSWDSIAFLGKRYGSSGWMLYRNSSDAAGYFRWYSFYVNTSDAVVSYRAWPSISGLSVDKWYFFTLSRDSLGGLKIYVDGKMTYQGAPPANFKSWSDNAYGIAIGAERAGSSSWLCIGAIMDDVRIFSEALPQARVQQLYADGLATHPPLAQQ